MSTWTCAKCGTFGPLNDWNIDKAECGVDGCDGARTHTARELSFAREASACRFEMHRLDAQLAKARAALEEVAALQPDRPDPASDSDYDDGIALGRWDAAEIARKALGGGE